jgi:hypothetical protein
MALERRLRAIEVRSKAPDEGALREAQATLQRNVDALQALAETMSDAHVALIQGDVDADALHVLPSGHIIATGRAHRLTREACERVHAELCGGYYRGGPTPAPAGPLTLPPVVAAIYTDDADVTNREECEACGYQLPVYRGTTGDGRVFARCPLYGGHIGRSAHLYSMQGRIRCCAACGELRPADAEERAHIDKHRRPRCHCLTAIEKDDGDE